MLAASLSHQTTSSPGAPHQQQLLLLLLLLQGGPLCAEWQSRDRSANSFTSPTHSGWLTKQGAIHKTWRKRYFVLNEHLLYYYTSSSVTNHTSFVECAQSVGAEMLLFLLVFVRSTGGMQAKLPKGVIDLTGCEVMRVIILSALGSRLCFNDAIGMRCRI